MSSDGRGGGTLPGGRRLRIGLSANFFAPDPHRRVYPRSRLLYSEEQMTRWLSSAGALVYAIPSSGGQSAVSAADYVEDLDALALAGGADVCPRSYGEEPIRPEWEGQQERDTYEIELTQRFMESGKPVLGICRGQQLLNVALGGSLYQDIGTQVPGALEHRSQEKYHHNLHEVDFLPGTALAALYPALGSAVVNSIHHQAVRAMADGLVVEARSSEDGVIEAIRLEGSSVGSPTYAVGVQWHPEFFALTEDQSTLDNGPILAEFMAAAAERARQGSNPSA